MNKYFPYPLRTTHLPDGRNIALSEPFAFIDDKWDFIAVPNGFISDLASIPRCFWILLPPFGEYLFGAIIHDWLYSTQALGRGWRGWREADKVLWRAMAKTPAPVAAWKRVAIFAGLFLGGWFTYFRVWERSLRRLGLWREENEDAPGDE